MKKYPSLLLALGATLLHGVCPDSSRAATTYVWTNTAAIGSWGVAANWSPAGPADGRDNTADFNQLSLGANQTVTLDGSRTNGYVIFGDQNTTKHQWLLSPGTGGSLTFSVSSGLPSLTVNTGVTATITAPLAGGIALNKFGSGRAVLLGTNTYSTGTELKAGTIEVNAMSGIGTGYLAVKNGATFRYTGYGTETRTTRLWLDLGASVFDIANASGVLVWNDSAAQGNKNQPFSKTGPGTLEVTAPFTGNASITVNDGILKLDAANTLSGNTVINQGQIVLGPAASLSSPTITIASNAVLDATALTNGFALGQQTLCGSGTLAGSLKDGVGSVISPGPAAGGLGTLIISSNLVLNGSGAFLFDIAGTNTPGGGANDLVVVQGDLIIAGAVLNFSFPGGPPLTNAPYLLLTNTGARSGSASGLVTYARNYAVTLDDSNPHALYATFTAAPETLLSASAGPRQRVLLDAGWRFRQGDPPDADTTVTVYAEISNLAKLQIADTNAEILLAAQRPDPVATHAGETVSFVRTNYDDSAWRPVNLPHDWVVELGFDSGGDVSHGCKALSGHTIAWYRRTFDLPANSTGKTLWLEFDGVYRNCLVWFNGRCLGRNAGGYGPFTFDITPYINPGGPNVLVARVDASRFEGWFYEGAGIYRHVWLVQTDPVHVAHWGTFVATAVTNDVATLTVQTEVRNDSANTVSCNLSSAIFDPSGSVVANSLQAAGIGPATNQIITQYILLTNAPLWSLESPNLHKLVSTLTQSGVTNDLYETRFGVRTLAWDANQGFLLNGQRVEAKGTCNHQDHAGVGSALPDRIQYYRVERLKEMGCNTYRTSHNPPTPELLDACDRLGMLVMDETRRVGWDAESLGQLERFIRRDRNHPSVFMWSLGNEENSIQGAAVGAQVMQTMQNLAHGLDPTRLCTVAMNGSWGSGFSTVIDVQGFNYNNGGIDSFHSSHPNLPSIGTEVASTVSTRGIYSNDTVRGYVSAYDLNMPGWGAAAEQWWPIYAARPWVAGGCVWTGFDYRGEPTPYSWPCISSHFGILDTCGFAKDIFYYYQANWTDRTVLHLLPHWNWAGREGQNINVWCFGNCETVELFLNGASQGRKTLNTQGHAEWNVLYAAGTLLAQGYRRGELVATRVVETAGAPAGVTLQPDRNIIIADGRDVSMVTVAVTDAQGRIVPIATNSIAFTITGGTLLGVGNGDPSCHEADKGTQRSVFNGLAQVIVQSRSQAGPIVLTATSPGLAQAVVTITAATNLPAPVTPSGLAAAGGDSRVVLSWDSVPGAIGYHVKRSTAGAGPFTLLGANLANATFIDTNATNGTTFYYVVSSFNDGGESTNSAAVSALPMQFVSGLRAAAQGSRVTLSWNAAPGASSYNVKRSTVAGGPYTTIAAVSGATNYTDSAVEGCTTYYYAVTLLSGSGESPNSTEVSALVPFLPAFFLNADIGAVGTPGNSTYCSGQFTVAGSGGDIWNNADAFQYAYRPMRGDGEIVARVASVQNTDGWAKSGVMIRETLAPDSAHAYALISWGNGAALQRRVTTAGASTHTAGPSVTAPYWVRLTRATNLFTAYVSSNGVSWTLIGSDTIPMSTNVLAGFAVTAHNNAALDTSVLDNFSGSFGSNQPPSVTLLAPTNNTSFIQPKTIVLNASAGDPDGTLTKVEFFAGTNLLGVVTNGTGGLYSLAWSNPPPSNYSLHARASDDWGDATLSATAGIVVSPLTLSVSGGSQNPGQFHLSFQGESSQAYVLETSTNLLDWTPVLTNFPVNGLFDFLNTNAVDFQRYYRARQ